MLGQILSDYGAAVVRLHRTVGAPEEVAGPGGALAAGIEARGVGAIAAALEVGERIELVDGDLAIEVGRRANGATMRVSWAGGPSYEEPVPVPAAPSPATLSVPVPVPATQVPASEPLFLPDPTSRVDDLVAALHTPSIQLYATRSGVYTRGEHGRGEALIGIVPAVGPERLGSRSFQRAHGTRASYVAGDMAGGIGSAEICIAMARAGLIGFFGAGGLPLDAVRTACERIRAEIGDLPAGFNLLHNPNEPWVEEATVDLYLQHGCRIASASAYMRLTPAVVRYRLTGIRRGDDGRVVCPNSVFAKVSRPEVAEQFLRPAPQAVVEELVSAGKLTLGEAELALEVPVAEDITVEGDSGGHTDRRPLVVLLPTILRQRDRIAREERYSERGIDVRVGAAGGLGDSASVHAAFALGADYVLTGSINQAAVEAGTSGLAKEMCAAAGIADTVMGPAPDMFELGAQVQVLGRGSMYAQRAGRLFELYKRYSSVTDIPSDDRAKVERTIFQKTFDEVWTITESYWRSRDPRELERAAGDPRHRMALMFRWYLGMTSRWPRVGDDTRKRDFQIWCGPAMGLFNEWVRGTWLEPLPARHVVAIADALMLGAASLRRVQVARALGLNVPAAADRPVPQRAGSAE